MTIHVPTFDSAPSCPFRSTDNRVGGVDETLLKEEQSF